MKKIVYSIAAVLTILVFTKCGNDPDKPDNPQPKTDSTDCCKTDNSINKERNSFTTIDIREIYVDEKDRKNFTIDYDPHNKPDFRRDSGLFYTRFIASGRFVKSSSFPVFIANLRSSMQATLGITDRSEYDQFGNETINGFRIYPALTTDNAGKKILYLVFLGEETITTQLGKLVRTTMLQNSHFYAIKDGLFSEIPSADTSQTRADILAFQNFWNTEFPAPTPTPSPNTNPNVNKSFSTSIAKYYDLLNGSNLNIYPGLTNAALQYGIVFYPCIENSKLIFIVKGFELGDTGNIVTFEDKYFYNNMDVCPDKCPKNELKVP